MTVERFCILVLAVVSMLQTYVLRNMIKSYIELVDAVSAAASAVLDWMDEMENKDAGEH